VKAKQPEPKNDLPFHSAMQPNENPSDEQVGMAF